MRGAIVGSRRRRRQRPHSVPTPEHRMMQGLGSSGFTAVFRHSGVNDHVSNMPGNARADEHSWKVPSAASAGSPLYRGGGDGDFSLVRHHAEPARDARFGGLEVCLDSPVALPFIAATSVLDVVGPVDAAAEAGDETARGHPAAPSRRRGRASPAAARHPLRRRRFVGGWSVPSIPVPHIPDPTSIIHDAGNAIKNGVDTAIDATASVATQVGNKIGDAAVQTFNGVVVGANTIGNAAVVGTSEAVGNIRDAAAVVVQAAERGAVLVVVTVANGVQTAVKTVVSRVEEALNAT